MISIKDLMMNEVKKSLERANVKADIDFLGNELVITIKANDMKEILLSGFPDIFRNSVQIECGDIKIKVKVM
jgi:frataxin-like iron-binding protein CyaY